MRTLDVFKKTEGSLLDDYASRLGEAVIRNRAALEVKAARIEAELAIKARSEFLANMNHELRTPLNAIIGFATMLRDAGDYNLSEDQHRNYAEYILQSGDLLLGHINTLLEVAALESGGVDINSDVVDAADILGEALNRAKVRAEAAQVRIDRRDEGAPVAGWGDAQRLSEAVDHVIQAAIKSCGEGGRVLVRACADEKGWSEIAVRDNGAGYTKDEIDEALTAFNQVHRGLDRSFAGPGVGFAVAKTFIELQGGRFTIKSRPGQGTLVQLALPPASNHQQTDNPELTNVSPQGDSETMEKKHDAA